MEKISFEFLKNEQLLTILTATFGIGLTLFLIWSIFKSKLKKENLLITFITLVFGLVTFLNLGSTKLPTTTFQPVVDNEYVILELMDTNTQFDELYALSGLGDSNANTNNYQLYFHDIQLVGSNDLSTWQHITTLSSKDFYKWTKETYSDWNFRYIKVSFPSKDGVLTELGIKRSSDTSFIPLKVIEVSNQANPYSSEWMIDENHLIALNPTFYDETFFDEIYHVRNAYEITQDQYLYAHVHPLLGTRLIGVGIQLFGMNPFGYRFMGALFSVLAIPLLYALLKALFKKPNLALIGSVLFAADFMHLTTGRIATLEPFSIFFILAMYYFMVRYITIDFFSPKLKQPFIYLGLSGLFMGLAWATKWTGLYASIGLAVIFFIHLYNQYKQIKSNDIYRKLFFFKLWRLFVCCVVAFIIIPVSIYFINYIGLLVTRTPYDSFGSLVSGVISYTQGIFNYHANLQATHPFESSWYHWLLDIRPIWYYFKSVGDGLYTISCFNNPLISWVGLISICYTAFKMIQKRSQVALVITLGYLSSFLPWVFIGRCLFSYHYYPSFPFLIMAIIYLFNDLLEKNIKYKRLIIGFTIICVLLFVIFLPVIAGHKTDLNYINTFTRWFESWYFGH